MLTAIGMLASLNLQVLQALDKLVALVSECFTRRFVSCNDFIVSDPADCRDWEAWEAHRSSPSAPLRPALSWQVTRSRWPTYLQHPCAFAGDMTTVHRGCRSLREKPGGLMITVLYTSKKALNRSGSAPETHSVSQAIGQ